MITFRGGEALGDEVKMAIRRVIIVVSAAVAFGMGVWRMQGSTSAMEFFAGYLVEQTLSVDNLFVFILLFDYFKVPVELQPRALKWGIIGAIIMRVGMIIVGVGLIKKFRVVVLLFAGILMASAFKLLFEGDGEMDMHDNVVLRLTQKALPSVDYFDEDKFVTIVDGVKRATPLLLCVVCIELSDFVFAVDSIPAVLSISKDRLIVISSNVFAIMALRSVYTLVAKMVSELPYLRPAVALILGFVGLKMAMEYFHPILPDTIHEIPTSWSLGIIAGLLAGGVLLSKFSEKSSSEKSAM